MGPLLSDPLFDILFIALASAIIYNLWQLRNRNATWKKLMSDLNFSAVENKKGRDKETGISGVYQKRQISLMETNVPVIRNGKSKTNFFTNAATVVKVNFDNASAKKLVISRNIPRWTSNGEQNTIGDKEIDRIFIVSSEPEDLAKNILTRTDIHDKALEINSGCLIEIIENEIRYDQSGRMTDPEKIVFLFDFLCALARALEA